MSERITLFAEVVLPIPLPRVYTYRIPYEWNDNITVGMRVIVPFGSKKLYSGIIWSLSDAPPEGYQANYIIEILDDDPIITQRQMEFWKWVSEYYMCFLGDVMTVALPSGYRVQSTTQVLLHENCHIDELEDFEFDKREKEIVDCIISEKITSVEKLQQTLNQKNILKYIKSLYMKGVISMYEDVKENYKPKVVEYVALSEVWRDNERANQLLDSVERKSPKQFEVLMRLLGSNKTEVELKPFLTEFNISRAIIKNLEKKEWLKIEKIKERHLSVEYGSQQEIQYTEHQQKAIKELNEAFLLHPQVLLHGETGSGKTLIYLEFVKKALSEGKQVLYLVPEVALTENLVGRIRHSIEAEIGVWHHYYSQHERTELYQMVKNLEVQFIIGTRTSIFLPFADLGLIVIDEEHESSYKQFEKRPLFHGRDSALYLARSWDAKVLLGSATPSYELMQRCDDNLMGYVQLTKRYDDRKACEWEFLNLKELKSQNRYDGIFSDPAKEAIKEALDKNNKVIVYHNRKGYSPYYQCNLCGYVTQCQHCDIALTYYKSSNKQRCNYCGYNQSIPTVCPGCGGNHFELKGTGTEKIVEELQLIFPEALIGRFDQQSIRKRKDFQQILNDFNFGKTDILVGTQLLSKGIDFNDIPLIVVPEADMSLNIPDFRSQEKAFQQFYQLSGRAGRGNNTGKIIIQTYRSQHPLFLALVDAEYDELRQSEIESRREFHYPPFGRLIEISVRHKDEGVVAQAAMIFNNILRVHLNDYLLGPNVPNVARVKGMYIQQFLLKLPNSSGSLNRVKQFLHISKQQLVNESGMNGVWIDFNVDPN